MLVELIHCLKDVKEIVNSVWRRENLVQFWFEFIIVTFCDECCKLCGLESVPSADPVLEFLVADKIDVLGPQGVNDLVVQLNQVIQNGIAAAGLFLEFNEFFTAF